MYKMSNKLLLLVKDSDGILTPEHAKKIQRFRTSQPCDLIISQMDNRFTAIISQMDKYDYILWTDDVNSLENVIDMDKIIKDDNIIVVSEDRHLLLIECIPKVRKLLYHWSQSVKDIYSTKRWNDNVVEMKSLNVNNVVDVVVDKGENKVEGLPKELSKENVSSSHHIVDVINEIDQTWLLVFLTLLLIVVSTKF